MKDLINDFLCALALMTMIAGIMWFYMVTP